MNDLPLNIKIENTRRILDKALTQCIMEYGLPAYLMSGIVSDLLLETKRQEKIELINSYQNVLDELKQQQLE